MLRLELLDQKMTTGAELTIADGKTYGALSNSLRLCLRELGGRKAKPSLTLADIANRHAGARP